MFLQGEVKLQSQTKLTLEVAKIRIEAARVEVILKKTAVTIAIVNQAGSLIALEKMDLTTVGRLMAVVEKSKSAITFGISGAAAPSTDELISTAGIKALLEKL